MDHLPRLVLGTAQFQQTYGISRSASQDSEVLSSQILKCADESGINYLDTARSYGESERLISSYKPKVFEVYTKIGNPPPETGDLLSWYANEVDQAKQALSPHNLTRVLLHDPDGFLDAAGSDAPLIADGLLGIFENVTFGASLYSPQQWASIRSIPLFKALQFPLSPFDRRFIDSGVAQEAHDSGLVLQARSIFLQGVLLAEVKGLPPYFARWGNLLTSWHDYALSTSRSPLDLCIAYVSNEDLVDEVVVGVKSAVELDEVRNSHLNSKGIYLDDSWSQNDEGLIDPRNWPK
jgi:aryl-alcohol dehydrogenase-like predicted oxidoreductase